MVIFFFDIFRKKEGSKDKYIKKNILDWNIIFNIVDNDKKIDNRRGSIYGDK